MLECAFPIHPSLSVGVTNCVTVDTINGHALFQQTNKKVFQPMLAKI